MLVYPVLADAPLRERLELRERSKTALRCAYCHESLPRSLAKRCAECATSLHEDCWKEAGACTTLGCARARRRMQLIVITRRERTSPQLRPESAMAAFFTSVVAAGCYWVLPAFRLMFEETGIPLPRSTELVVSIPSFVWLVSAGLCSAALLLKDHWLTERWAGRVNVAALVATLTSVPWIAWALFLPLISISERL